MTEEKLLNLKKHEEYTAEEIQAALGITKTTVYRLIKADLFESYYVDGQYKISKNSFDEWFDNLNKDINECQKCD